MAETGRMDQDKTQTGETFADVILPLPLPKSFTYSIPSDLLGTVTEGSRVIVQFGSKKVLTGIVRLIHTTHPEKYEPRPLMDVLDEKPVINPRQLKLFEWIASYYMCTIGEVMNVALPSGLKLSSESKIMIHPEYDFIENDQRLNTKESDLLRTLQEGRSVTYPQAARLLELKNAYHVIKSLMTKNAVLIYEEVKDKYVPRREKRVRLNQRYEEDTSLIEELFEGIGKHPMQENLVLQYLKSVNIFENPVENRNGMPKARLLLDGSSSSLKTLIKKEIFEEFQVVSPRFAETEITQQQNELTDGQKEVKNAIVKMLPEKDAVLLHGITGSGKTEIYTGLIEDYLSRGYQALYLLPEIALTTHIVSRLKNIFGKKLGVYHSKYSDNERVEVWQGVLDRKFQVVIGVRSAVFLPFPNLGIIIIDEEHETSYKQNDPAPRYHARDVALVIAKQTNAHILLGSATPSIESYFHAKSGKYGFVKLGKRYGKAVMPEIRVIDTKKERKQKLLKNEFTSVLIKELEDIIEKKKQAILFQNRRGYSPYVTCDDCGYIPQCHQCSVSLTYHMYQEELICHYCGFKSYIPDKCEQCGSTRIRTVGFGTEKIEDDLKLLIPDANIQRMDLDSTRSKLSYQKILDRFSNGSIDFLVGTQMVTKGLDFDNVNLVGILDADRMIGFPDFRSTERAFQLMVQVSGRAGRREERGKVIIQTSNPGHPLIKQVIENDFEGMVEFEMNERKKFGYPPFTRLIRITARHTEKEYARLIASQAAGLIRNVIGSNRVLGPEENLIPRIRNEYYFNLLIKLEREGLNISGIKKVIRESCRSVMENTIFRKGRIIFDVDPY